jgi:hypothetical protein
MQWNQWLPLTEWWYNTYFHIATYMTPFEVVYGKNPPSIISYMAGISKVQEVENNVSIHEAILITLKTNLAMDQNFMKKQVYQGHSERQFVEGD